MKRVSLSHMELVKSKISTYQLSHEFMAFILCDKSEGESYMRWLFSCMSVLIRAFCLPQILDKAHPDPILRE